MIYQNVDRLGMPLTQRQCDALRVTAGGLTDKEAGFVLGIAERTVKNHLWSANRRLGTESRAQAWIKLGWLRPPTVCDHDAGPALRGTALRRRATDIERRVAAIQRGHE